MGVHTLQARVCTQALKDLGACAEACSAPGAHGLRGDLSLRSGSGTQGDLRSPRTGPSLVLSKGRGLLPYTAPTRLEFLANLQGASCLPAWPLCLLRGALPLCLDHNGFVLPTLRMLVREVELGACPICVPRVFPKVWAEAPVLVQHSLEQLRDARLRDSEGLQV